MTDCPVIAVFMVGATPWLSLWQPALRRPTADSSARSRRHLILDCPRPCRLGQRSGILAQAAVP